MPDYHFVCWDMHKFDIHSVKYVEQACEMRKWAFAADYIRLYALYHHGGIYLDSDVVVFKRFDDFLSNKAFASVESYFYRKGDRSDFLIDAAMIASEAGNPFIKECLGHYEDIPFIKADGQMDQTVICNVLSDVAESKFGFVPGSFSPSPIHLAGDVLTLYPPHVFTHLKGAINGDSVAMHLYEGSWRDKQEVRSRVIKSVDDAMEKVLGLRRWSLMRWAVRRRYLKLRDGSRSAL